MYLFSSIVTTLLIGPALVHSRPTTLAPRGVSATQVQTFDFWMQYASAAYCVSNYEATAGTPVECFAGNCDSVEAANATIELSFSGTTITDTAGFIAVDNVSKAIVLSFRGTNSVRNWLTDAAFVYTTPGLCDGCQAELGFWTAWAGVRDTIIPVLKTLTASYPDYELVVLGHSLGAAIATLSAADLRIRGYEATLYAYASPRVGNPALATFITNQGNNYRFTHTDDPVPKLPMIIMGYVHISPEYYITSGNNVTVTGSDITVLDGEINFNGNTGTGIPLITAFNEHVWYFLEANACAPSMTFK